MDIEKAIEGYLRNDPDPELEDGQYYFMHGEKVIKVYPLDILPYDHGTEYGLYQKAGGRLRWVDARQDGNRCRGVEFGYLYDNKEDCRNHEHDWYNGWEELRKIQKERNALK